MTNREASLTGFIAGVAAAIVFVAAVGGISIGRMYFSVGVVTIDDTEPNAFQEHFENGEI